MSVGGGIILLYKDANEIITRLVQGDTSILCIISLDVHRLLEIIGDLIIQIARIFEVGVMLKQCED